MSVTLLTLGPAYDLNNKDGVLNPNTYVALPGRLCQISIQSIFAEAPDSLDVGVEFSNDAVEWVNAGSFSEVGGELQDFLTAARFMRLNGTITGGSGPQFLAVAKA